MIDKLPNNGFMTGDSDNLQNARNEFFDDYENTAIPTFTNDNLTNTNNNTPPPRGR
jgi:hypothetical protein